MPQLWTETFVTQYFWLVAILLGFYYVASTTIIPQIANTLKIRREISNNEKIIESKDQTVNLGLNSDSTSFVLNNLKNINSSKEVNLVNENILANVKNEWVKKYTA